MDDSTVPLKPITDYKIILINPDHNEKYTKRKEAMLALFKSIGFKNIQHYKSSAVNYPACLRHAVVDILQQHLDEPILLVEDDLGWNKIKEIRVPSTADAIYLGLSRWSGHPTENKGLGYSEFAPWSASLVRVKNMLATHAILYISRAYKEAVIAALKSVGDTDYHGDVLMSRLQPSFTVLATKKPVFYQAALYNQSQPMMERWTNFTIS
jgi:hypothetical protein